MNVASYMERAYKWLRSNLEREFLQSGPKECEKKCESLPFSLPFGLLSREHVQ